MAGRLVTCESWRQRYTYSQNIRVFKYEKNFSYTSNILKNFWNVISAAIVPATFLIAASYAGCDEILSVIFFTISIGGHGFNSAGAAINLFDLAPNYVSPINGIINSVANIVGISAPYIAGVLTPNVNYESLLV